MTVNDFLYQATDRLGNRWYNGRSFFDVKRDEKWEYIKILNSNGNEQWFTPISKIILMRDDKRFEFCMNAAYPRFLTDIEDKWIRHHRSNFTPQGYKEILKHIFNKFDVIIVPVLFQDRLIFKKGSKIYPSDFQDKLNPMNKGVGVSRKGQDKIDFLKHLSEKYEESDPEKSKHYDLIKCAAIHYTKAFSEYKLPFRND